MVESTVKVLRSGGLPPYSYRFHLEGNESTVGFFHFNTKTVCNTAQKLFDWFQVCHASENTESIFPTCFAGQRVFNKDPIVWLDRARPPPKSTGKFSRVEH